MSFPDGRYTDNSPDNNFSVPRSHDLSFRLFQAPMQPVTPPLNSPPAHTDPYHYTPQTLTSRMHGFLPHADNRWSYNRSVSLLRPQYNTADTTADTHPHTESPSLLWHCPHGSPRIVLSAILPPHSCPCHHNSGFHSSVSTRSHMGYIGRQ